MQEILPFLSYCVLMSGTPGPNNMMLVANGATHGYRHTLPAILGISLGSLALTLASCLGLGALFLAWPSLRLGLKLAGTLYLLVLAWQLVGRPVGPTPAAKRLGFWQMALFQALNPKSWVRALTIGSVFMPADLGLLPGALLVSGVGALVGIPCVSIWALFGSAIGRFLSNPARRRVFNAIMGISLAVLALMLLLR